MSRDLFSRLFGAWCLVLGHQWEYDRERRATYCLACNKRLKADRWGHNDD